MTAVTTHWEMYAFAILLIAWGIPVSSMRNPTRMQVARRPIYLVILSETVTPRIMCTPKSRIYSKLLVI